MKDKNGKPVYKAGKLNGWLVEQGGYPPLAFGFSGGLFYIKANSDRKWLTDKDDRCNANPGKTPVMKPLTSEYKASTIAYKLPLRISRKTAGLLSVSISTGRSMARKQKRL